MVEGKKIEDLVTRSTRHKAHGYHADVSYEYLKNYKINIHTKKENYEEIKSEQVSGSELWLFDGHHPNPPIHQ